MCRGITAAVATALVRRVLIPKRPKKIVFMEEELL
jgi:hypothetical protein